MVAVVCQINSLFFFQNDDIMGIVWKSVPSAYVHDMYDHVSIDVEGYIGDDAHPTRTFYFNQVANLH